MTDNAWRKSSFSNGNGGNNCVEVKTSSAIPGASDVLVRHSRYPHQWMAFTQTEWQAFIAGVKNGEFDDLTL